MKIINQTINLNGFVSNIDIEPDEYLLPLQEVIVNAIQSIEDKQDTYRSSIGINIIRNSEPVLSEEEFDEPYHPILGFEVTDNGVGFTEKRFKAFNEIYTDINRAKGCKGVGRYSVLACFGSMNVDSSYFENSIWRRRSFKFSAINGLIVEQEPTDDGIDKEVFSTKVSLNGYKKEFYDYIIKKKITAENIAEAIIHHCLMYFIREDMPIVRIFYDGDKDNAIVINDLFHDVIKFDRAPREINITGSTSPFVLNYIRNYANRTHSMHLCANNREVGKKISLSTYIPSVVLRIS